MINTDALKEAIEDFEQYMAFMNAQGGKLIVDTARLVLAMQRALEIVMIGGNHLGNHRTDKWPPKDTQPLDALELLGAGVEYDMWCCWSAIMRAWDIRDTALVHGRAREHENKELPDDLRIPLHSLQADVKYLIGRVQADGSVGGMIADSILERLSQIENACYRAILYRTREPTKAELAIAACGSGELCRDPLDSRQAGTCSLCGGVADRILALLGDTA